MAGSKAAMDSMGWWARLRGRAPPHSDATQHTVDLPGLGPTLIGQTVECVGAMCPRPQLLVMKVLGNAGLGEVIEVRCDNAPAVEGFPALALALGSTHLLTLRAGDLWCVYLRKGV